jgi:recyclin-1
LQVGDYITALLERAREVSTAMFLQASAACFRESSKMVDALLQAAAQRSDSGITKIKAEDIVYVSFIFSFEFLADVDTQLSDV